MKLCFAHPLTQNTRGPFVNAHLKLLNADLEIYNGWYPEKNSIDGNIMIFPYNILLFRSLIKKFLPKVYHTVYSKSLLKSLKNHNIDVVFIEYGPTGVSMTDALIKGNIPFVVHFHGFDAYHYPSLKKYLPGYKKMFAYAQGLVSVSLDMIEQLVKLGADREKISLVSCGADPNFFYGAKPELAPPYFIALGRFTAKKSPQNTIRAFKIVHDELNTTKLFMIGEGEVLDESKDLARSLGLEDSVVFLGLRYHDEVLSYFRASMVFVQHSLQTESGDREGSPVSIVEAAAAGLPVVSTLHEGIKQAVIHGKTGYLVNEGDYQSMAKYMLKLIKDPKLSAEMGQAGRLHVIENYDLVKQGDKLKDIIKRISIKTK